MDMFNEENFNYLNDLILSILNGLMITKIHCQN